MKRQDFINLGATAFISLLGSLVVYSSGSPVWAATMTFLLVWVIVIPRSRG